MDIDVSPGLANIKFDENVNGITWSPDGTHLAVSRGHQNTAIFHITEDTCTLVHTIPDIGWTASISWSPDGKQIAGGYDTGEIRIWKLGKRRPSKIIRSNPDYTRTIAWSPDGTKIAGGGWSGVDVWNVYSGETTTRLLALNTGIHLIDSISWSPDGKRLATGAESDKVRIWDVESSVCIHTLPGHGRRFTLVAYSPDGSRLVSGAGEDICIWDSNSGELISKFSTDSGSQMTSLAWSPDGRHIVAGTDDRILRLWHLESENMLDVFTEHFEEYHTFQCTYGDWSPDDTRIASAANQNVCVETIVPLKAERETFSRTIDFLCDRDVRNILEGWYFG